MGINTCLYGVKKLSDIIQIINKIIMGNGDISNNFHIDLVTLFIMKDLLVCVKNL